MSEKSQTPTGVFVRLPLSDEQKRKVVAEMMFAGTPVTDAFEKAILSIGTPVTGAGLDPSRGSFEAFYSQMCAKATGCAGVNPDYVRGLRSGDGYGYRTFLNNVWEAWPEFIDFAQARLAERDAEIARLAAEAEKYQMLLKRIINKASMSCVRTLSGRDSRLLAGACADAREALKGPEA